MLKREWGVERNVKLPHLFIPGSRVAVKDLPSSRTAALVPEFAVKYLSLGRKPDDYIYIYIYIKYEDVNIVMDDIILTNQEQAELILQTFCHFTYVTTHSPTPKSLYLRHSSISNPSVASSTLQFILQPFFRFSYVTSSSLNSPGEPPMSHKNLKL